MPQKVSDEELKRRVQTITMWVVLIALTLAVVGYFLFGDIAIILFAIFLFAVFFLRLVLR